MKNTNLVNLAPSWGIVSTPNSGHCNRNGSVQWQFIFSLRPSDGRGEISNVVPCRLATSKRQSIRQFSYSETCHLRWLGLIEVSFQVGGKGGLTRSSWHILRFEGSRWLHSGLQGVNRNICLRVNLRRDMVKFARQDPLSTAIQDWISGRFSYTSPLLYRVLRKYYISLPLKRYEIRKIPVASGDICKKPPELR